MEYRPFYMAQEWVRMGHQVTIVGADFSHLRSQQPVAGMEYIAGIRYMWLKTLRYRGNGLGRICNMLFFLFRLFWERSKIIAEYRPDVVIASSTYPLDIYPARWIAEKYRAKLVYEVHDLWPLSPMKLGGMSSYHPFIFVLQLAENYAYRKVDCVVSMLPKAEQYMRVHGLSAGKFKYIPNGVVVSDWSKAAIDLPQEHFVLLQKLRHEKQFIVGYAGGHSISNALEFLLQAAEKVSTANIAFVLVGNGQKKNELQRLVNDYQIDNVFFLPAISKKAIPRLLEQMDALYIGWHKSSLYRFGICPNKLFDYMMAGKPIIHSVEAGNDLVSEAGCGISVSAEDSSAIAKAILKMQSLPPEERLVMGAKGKKFVLANHDYKLLAAKFLDAVKISDRSD